MLIFNNIFLFKKTVLTMLIFEHLGKISWGKQIYILRFQVIVLFNILIYVIKMIHQKLLRGKKVRNLQKTEVVILWWFTIKNIFREIYCLFQKCHISLREILDLGKIFLFLKMNFFGWIMLFLLFHRNG